MSYWCGTITRKLARDFRGMHVVLVARHTTRGGTVFAEGDACIIRKAWKGRLILERVRDGARISGVSGFDVEPAPEAETQTTTGGRRE